MRVTGAKKLTRQLSSLPAVQRRHVAAAVRKSVEEGVRVARSLAPDVTGETRAEIKAEFSADGMSGVIVVIDTDAGAEEKAAAYSKEHGRKRGERGSTAGFHYVYRTRQYLAKRWKSRLKRAVKKAAKEVSNG